MVGKCGSKVSQFAKNAPLNALIILARDECFLILDLFFKTYPKGGPLDDFSKRFLGSPLWLFFVAQRKSQLSWAAMALFSADPPPVSRLSYCDHKLSQSQSPLPSTRSSKYSLSKAGPELGTAQPQLVNYI